MSETKDMHNTLLQIKSLYDAFTKTEQKVAGYVLSNIETIVYMSVTEMAERVDVGETTVLRFCRKLGFKGFQDFKITLAKSTSQLPTLSEEIKDDDSAEILRDKLIQSQIQVLKDMRSLLNQEELEKAIEVIVEADSIHFFGVGTSYLTAAQGAHSFMRIGKDSSAKQDVHFQAMSTALLTKRDVVIGISVSGEANDTVGNMRLAQESGAKTICITSSAKSSITSVSDISLLTATIENPLHGSSMSAKITQLAILDILYTGVLLNDKENALNFREKTALAVANRLN